MSKLKDQIDKNRKNDGAMERTGGKSLLKQQIDASRSGTTFRPDQSSVGQKIRSGQDSAASNVRKELFTTGSRNIKAQREEYQRRAKENRLDLYDPVQRGAEEYQADIDRLTAQRKKLADQWKKSRNTTDGRTRNVMLSKDEVKAERSRAARMKEELDSIDRQLEEAKTGKWRAENQPKYNDISSRGDFAKKARIVDEDKVGKARFHNRTYATGDETYGYINNVGGQRPSSKSSYLYKYSFMTQDEKDIYNYLYQAEGRKSADDYLGYIEYDLDYRRSRKNAAETAENARAHPVKESLLSVPENLLSGVGLLNIADQNLLRNASEQYTPINYYAKAMDHTNYTGAVRGSVAQGLADKYGSINISEEDHPVWARILNGKSLGDVYQLGMSMVDSGATAALGSLTGMGAFGTVLLGGSAGSQGVLDALEKGATDDQALKMGLLNGTFEALFEFVSLDHLLKGDTSNIVKAVLEQGFVEGAEELNTTLANTIAEICVMAEKSDYRTAVNQYMEQGYSQKDAEVRAMEDIAIGMGWDFIGGAISGGVMAGAKAATNNYVMEPHYYAKTYGPSISDLVTEGLDLSAENKMAQKVKKKLDEKKRVSGQDIRKLVDQNEQIIRAQDMDTIRSAAARKLTEYGETGDVDQIAQAIAKQASGKKLSVFEERAVFNSDYGRRVANELDPANIENGGYNTQWAEELGTNRINEEAYSRLVSDAFRSGDAEQTTVQQELPAEQAWEETTRQTVQEDTQDTQEAKPEPAQEIVQEPVREPEPAQEPVTYEPTEQTGEETSPQTEGEEARETAEETDLEELSGKYGYQAKAFVHTYQPGQDVARYDMAYSAAYDYGKSGVPFDTVDKLDSVAYLTQTQRGLAYEAGKSAAMESAKQRFEQVVNKTNGNTGRRVGAVSLENGVKAADLNQQQRTAAKVLRVYAEATGIDIVLYRSAAGENGTFTEAQGSFRHKSPDKLYIDLNSGLMHVSDMNDLGKYAMLRTFSHEFVHFVEYWNPVRYNEFRSLIFQELTRRGENVDDLIEEKQDGTDLSYDAASREVVAEAMTDILPDSHFVQNMAEHHKSLFRKLLDKLHEFVSDLREYFATIGGNRSREANALKEQIGDALHYAERIVELYDSVAEEAVEHFQKAYAVEEKEPAHDFATAFENASREEKDEVIQAMDENMGKPSHVFPTELRGEELAAYEEGLENGGQDESDEGTVLQPESHGEGTARLLDELQNGDVQHPGGQRETVAAAEERGGPAGRDGHRTDTADRAGGSEGDRPGGDLRPDRGGDRGGRPGRGDRAGQTASGDVGDVLRDEATAGRDAESGPEPGQLNQKEQQKEQQAKAEKLQEVAAEQTEQTSKPTPKGSNFSMGESLELPKGEKARFRANVDAIRLIKQLESEGRYATAEEQEVLSKYVGWGGLSNAFGELRYNQTSRKSEMTAKTGWEKEFEELRQLVTDGVISEEEYKAMSASTKNAHYTSLEVIRAMYDGLARLGYTGGRMLEPSAGVGNFVGGMPTEMSRNVRSWTMVELDRITGQIAKYLYPNADVRIQGFETANIPDGYMDVAIGNVPFGDYGVVDRRYPKRVTKSIHNYFFAKTLDKVRPGGLVMFITSSFTMNGTDSAIRQYIMDRADLLGAIRLPNTAFAGNAGTSVVTDILVLKKRAPMTEYSGEAFLHAPNTEVTGNKDPGYWRASSTVPVNEYFLNHPEMVLGKAEIARGMYGANSLTYAPLTDQGTLGDQIRKAFANIEGKMDYPAQTTPEKANFAVQQANKKTKNNGLEVKEDGKVYRNENGTLVEVSADKATVERVTGLLGIRDAYRTLVNYMQQGQEAKFIKKARADLNKAYDAFVQKYGYINSTKNKAAIAEDPDRYSLLSLENYDAKKKTATKADIFTKNTISPNQTIAHVDDLAAGVIVSINRMGSIDPAYIAKLTDKTESEVTRELVDSRMAFKTRDGGLESPETYLSGNVRAKLREAEALAPLDKDFQNNVEELRKVIPKDIPFTDIFAAVGTPWIPNEVYADFIAEMLGGQNRVNSYSGPDVTVGRTNTGEFKIVLNNARLKGRYQNTQKWGTKRKTFLDLMNAMMSNGSLTVNDYVEDNGRKHAVVNKVESAAAQAKAEEISKAFQEWIWKDEKRRDTLAGLYNETFNALVTPKYTGENLTVNGLNAEFSLRKHQADAVQRIISSGGNTLLAHRVGAGKTLEMAAAAMKMRELGLVKKPMFVVPKSLVAQWGVEFKSYFPAARLLVSDEKSFTKENRRTFSNRIANGDYDAVILSYEQFEKVPMSAEYKAAFYQQQIDEIMDAIAEEKAEYGKGITVKEMEKRKAQLEKKQKELTSKPKDEENIDFDQLGIDSLFVDEAHNFKNLEYVTRMQNVSGLGNTKGSQRAFDLYTKVRYLQGLNGGRGIVFATATPVMNSMAEMYIMQKYLQSDMLNQLGLKTFDAWAKQFGEVVNSVEIKPSGQGFRVKQTFSNFRNLNELQLLFRSFSDVLTEVPGLKIPKMKGGKVQVVVCEPSQFQKNYMAELEKRADNVKNVDPSEDNMLKITSDGRKVSYTQRMIDPSLPYEPGCKLYRCCDNVLEEYKDSKAIKGTQIIFCDMATPKGKSTKSVAVETEAAAEMDTESAKLYDDMKEYLVKRGIPAKEIAFIHDAKTDDQKKQLFADVNDGKVRVLIGSTGKMGVGMNAQKRIVAIHHLDAPWRPGDVEQRDGRAFRQKNMNDEVTKYTYVTEGSFDARLWDILDRKQHFINQIMNGEDVGRSAEDTGDVTLSAAEVKALASGNPMIMEQVQLNNDLSRLQDLKRAHNSQVTAAKAKLLEDEQKIGTLTQNIQNLKADIKARVDTYSEKKFAMKVGDRTFTKKKDAGTALAAAIASKAKDGEYVTVGEFAGFALRVMKNKAEYTGLVSGAQGYKYNVYPENATYMVNHIIGVVEKLDTKLENWTERLAELKTDRDAQERMAKLPFEKQTELEEKTARFNEIMSILNPKEEQFVGDDEVQEQRRKRNDEWKKPKRKRTAYSETETLFLQWQSGSAPEGEVKRFTRFRKHRFYMKTADGCVEISGAQYDERSDFDAENIDRRYVRQASPAFVSDEGAQGDAAGYSEGDRDQGGTEVLSGHSVGERLRDDAGGSVRGIGGHSRGVSDGVSDEQHQRRSSPLTDREVLYAASNDVDVDGLTAGETDALRIFRQRLETLMELDEKRAAEGRRYKEQRFGKHVDPEAAAKTKNRMEVLDGQIQRASQEVLKVEQTEVLKRVLHRARKVVEQQEREHGKELLARYRDRQRNAAAIKKYKARIKKDTDSLTKWVLHPSNKNAYQRVPDALKNSVIPFLTSIDFTSKRQLNGGDPTKADAEFLKRVKALRDAIKQNIDIQGMYSGYSDLPEGFMDEMQQFIDAAETLSRSHQGQFVVNRMSSEELKTLSKLVRVVKSLVVNMNSFHQNAMFQHAYEAGESSLDYMRQMGSAKRTGAVSEFLLWQQMRPAYAFERFGEGGVAVYDEFRRAQATLAFNTIQVKEFAESAYTDKEVRAWERETKSFLLDGEQVDIPVSYLMGLYELSKRPQALSHLLEGGLRVATHSDGKQKVADVGHRLTKGDLETMIAALTDRQKEVADRLQQFMAQQGAEWGNHVSVARFGIEQFGEEHYYPINSDGRHLQSNADERPDNAGLYALLNMGFTKELQEKAGNRIILYSIFDVFANHMASMAQYNAFALPILDSLKWLNYEQVEKQEDGSKTILGTVREEMARVYGTPEESRPGSGRKGYAENFVLNIIRAFNGTETQGIYSDSPGINAMHRYNIAQVAYNLRVVLQQPLAVTRAGMLLDYGNIIKGMSMSAKTIRANIEEMHRYSGIAAWKDLGFYDVNISRGLTDIIKHNDAIDLHSGMKRALNTTANKVNEIGMLGAEKADQITWAAMWNACKEQVMREKGRADEETFFAQVTELFEDVIYKTQVVDSVLTKNEFLRSKGTWARLTGSFMSEPTTTASMLVDAYDKYARDMQRGMSRQQAWQLHGKNIARTAYVYAVGAVLLAVVTAVADAMRDDDDYATFLEKFLDKLGGNLLDELMPMNKLPIMRDVYDLLKAWLGKLGFDTYGNEPRSVIFQWREYLLKSSEVFHDRISGEKTNYTWYGGCYKLLQALSGALGLPMASATREVVTIWNNTIGGMAPSLKVKSYDPGVKANVHYAYEDGYLTREEAIAELVNKKAAEDADEAYWFTREFDGFNKYDRVKNAVEAQDSQEFQAAIDELTTHGVKKEDAVSKTKSIIRELFDEGAIDAKTAEKYLKMFVDADDAEDTTNAWRFRQRNDVDWTQKQIVKYQKEVEPHGISVSVYDQYLTGVKSCKGTDEDGDGRADSGTVKAEKLKLIDSLPISRDQKDTLYLMNGWSETKIYEAPWY